MSTNQPPAPSSDAQLLQEENERLRARLDDLQARLEEPEDIVRAIRHGEVDAFVVSEARGERIYSLRNAEVLHRAMIEEMKEGAVTLDASGLIIYCNPYFAELIRAKRSSLIGAKILPFVAEESRDFFQALGAHSATRIDRKELALAANDGELVPVLATMNRLHLEENEIFCLIVTDLRKQKREEQLLDESRRKDEFLAMLAHELRNPIAPIRTAAELLRPGAGEPRLEWARQVIERQVGHMTRLIDDLLDVSRITRGQIRLDLQPTDLAAAVNRALETVRPWVEARHHQLDVALPTQPLWVLGDLTRLSQAVSNLLNNAAKFTPERGRITVTVARRGGWAELSVRDSGIGITPEMLPRVFELYTQADSTQKRSEGGLGIGLTLVRTLIELHGGTVQARSAGPNQGSEFVIRLPLQADAVPPAPSEAVPARAPRAAGQRRKILVVDDNPDAAETLTTLLQDLGHEVRLATSAPGALAEARDLVPDVMLIDIGLPGMSGHEMARRVRELPALAHCVLIAVTGYGQDEDRRASTAAGFDHHWVKPLNVDDLIAFLAAPSR